MQVDESKHSEEALESGAENLPEGLKICHVCHRKSND